jgi:hypothetical protein
VDVPDPGGMLLLNTDGCGERIFRPVTRRIPWRELGGSLSWYTGRLDRSLACLRRKYAPDRQRAKRSRKSGLAASAARMVS